ncbi:hypothetical protein DYI25_05570 [Mesobacillus boroniphilus]|uniref:Uncharacterized protein n=1 Tax=Mesobacillus boroniphilus TaxID=308892 RepID=A0A944GWQ6_9BACI|nr:hypothetical protein [Mesobacillus boroniphilus]MBS8263905.1 hypothetical protein [Mesobacillus boroniphilus]
MKEFTIAGKQGFVRIELNEVFGFPDQTSYLGGYDVHGKIELKSGNYFVKDADLWFSTGQVYKFFLELQKCYNDLQGSAIFSDSENALKINLNFNKLGQISIEGYFQEIPSEENTLQFEFESEQSYLGATLQQLNSIFEQYGGLKGKS